MKQNRKHPDTPKVLPWLAKRAGVPFERAVELWVGARHHAAATHEPGSPGYWETAVERLQENLAAESRSRQSAPFGLGPLVRLPASQWLQGLALQEKLVAIAANSARNWAHYWTRTCCH